MISIDIFSLLVGIFIYGFMRDFIFDVIIPRCKQLSMRHKNKQRMTQNKETINNEHEKYKGTSIGFVIDE